MYEQESKVDVTDIFEVTTALPVHFLWADLKRKVLVNT